MRTRGMWTICALLATGSAFAAMMTEWGAAVTPENAWREYPRPQMVRSNWTCLNGLWDYAVTSVTNTPGRPEKWDGRILVPFAIESPLSGVGRLLNPDELLWYTREIVCHPRPGERILLNFDGVDFRTMVFIGHREVTAVPHAGGDDPFTLDITDYVKEGANELTVCVWDPTDGFVNPHGKQALNPKGCFYTRSSGIWQSVWMETVPESYIRDYKVTADVDNSTVKFDFDIAGKGDVAVKIDEVSQSGESGESGEVVVKIPNAKLWSPETPYLYRFTAKCGKDEIRGYFAMRKFSKGKDAKGRLRFMLNDRPVFLIGTLDQGWWPDGLLTPPSEEAMAFDIRTLKRCGFNMLRKHEKVEPRRYYALCDRLGLMVIQDMPTTADGNERKVALDPFSPETIRYYGFQREALKRMIDGLQKVPSIVMWCPYNEGWSQPGQFLTHSTLDFVRDYDPTRLVNGPSGWVDFEGGERKHCGKPWTAHRPDGVCEAADTIDMHFYRGPGMHAVNGRRISFLGEFGGLGHAVSNHLWSATESWGYGGLGDTATREGLEKTYLALMDRLAELAAEGLSGSVYTQTTDVELEINGLMTYDRKVLKFDPNVLKAAHEKVRAQVLK